VHTYTCLYWLIGQVVLKMFAAAFPNTADYCFYLDLKDKKHTLALKPEGISFLIKKNKGSITFKYSAVSLWKTS